MKHSIISLLIVLFICSTVNAQINVGSNTAPDSSAMLQISGNTKGFLPPRMSRDSMYLIAKPAKGLLVFNTTDSLLFMRRDSGWVALAAGDQVWQKNGNDIYNQNSGFVGIGTTTPSTLLHVEGANPLTLLGVADGTTDITDSVLTITNGLVRKIPLSSLAVVSNGISQADAPLVYSNGVISINLASTTDDGYLSAGDYNIFNNKVSSISLNGSPVYTTTTFGISSGAATGTLNLSTQAKNRVFAGPVSGANAQPAFRALVGADLPIATTNTTTGLGGVIVGSGLSVTAGGVLSATNTSTGSVTSASVVTANGLAGTVANPTTTPAITLTTTVTGMVKGNGTALSAATSGTDYAPGTAANSTGIVKSTTGTGALTTATASDFPTLNQNTTGTAANITGVLNATSLPALTGDVTSTAGSASTTISNSAVTNAKIANMAANTFKANNTGSPAAPSDITATQATAMLDVFSSTAKGLTPASGGGTANFLRADGTFAVPPGTNTNSGTVTSVSVTAANGVSGTVATNTTTPAISLTLGAITPSSVAATGTVTGSNLSGSHSGTSSGTNTGDETNATIKTKLGPATTTNDGYLTATDWNTFNNKASTANVISSLNGLTATSQTFATPGTTGTAPAWSSAGSVHTLNIPLASATGVTAGLLSNADWNTFNNKASTTNSWSTTGNAGTSSATNFLGTTDNTSLRFRSNNIQRMILDSLGNVGIGTDVFDATNPEKFLINAGNTSSVNGLVAKGTINNYFQMNIKNLSSGANATSDIVATANNGTETSNYVDLGINGSGYTGSAIQTGVANDGYLISAGNDFYMVNSSANKSMLFLTGGTGVANERMRILANGRVGMGVQDPTAPFVVKDTMEIRRVGSLSQLLFTNTAGTGDFRIGGDGGDLFWQGGGSRALQMGSYWTTILGGDRQGNGGAYPAFINGTGGTGVLVQAQRDASVPFAVQSNSASQLANLTEWRNSSGTAINVINNIGNLGLGTTNPSYKLQVSSTADPLSLLGVQTGSNTDSLLTIIGGVVKKLSPSALSIPSSNAWSLTGNTNTLASNYFLGTTNSDPLIFKVNSQIAGRLDASNTFIGSLAGNSNGTTANQNTGIGYQSLSANTSGTYNTAIGYNSLQGNVSGSNNIGVGYGAAVANNSSNSIAIGISSYVNNASSIAVGTSAQTNNTSALAIGNNTYVNGLNGIAIGNGSSTTRTQAYGDYATAIGYNAYAGNTNSIAIGSNINSNASNSIAIGPSTSATVANSTALGASASAAGVNSTAIGYNAAVASDNTIILGDKANAALSVGIGSEGFSNGNREKLLVDAGSSSSVNVISGKGNLNNYLQLNIQNKNAGASASSDLVATADNGDETNNYVDLGINSSGNTANLFGGANDAYLYAQTQNLLIGTASASKSISFLTGGGTQSTNERMRIDGSGKVGIGNAAPTEKLDVTGNVKFSGALMPNNTAGTAGQVLTSGGSNASPTWTAAGTVTGVSINSANGFAGTSNGSATAPVLTIQTTVPSTKMVRSNGTGLVAATSGTDYAPGTAGNTTGIVKSTTGTGALTTAVASDFPTLNQNTTGNAATVTTNANMTGDVTSVGNATTISNNAVTNAKLATMAANTFKANNTGATANATDITATQATAMLDVFTSTAKGLVPASGGGTTNFLRADGTFAAPTVTNSNSWSLTGNSGTNSSANFLGTTDAQPVLLKVNNQQIGRLELNSFAFGAGAGVNTATNSMALGYGATLGSGVTNAMALGSAANAGISNTFVIGNSAASSNAGNSFAIGNSATVASTNSFVIGSGASTAASITDAFAIGSSAIVNGSNSLAIGKSASTGTGATSAVAIGNGVQANATGSVSIGAAATAVGTGSTNSIAIGTGASIGSSLTNSTAIGANASTTFSNTMILGDRSNQLLSVGIGSEAFSPSTREKLLVDGGTVASDGYISVIGAKGSTNNYMQVNLQNRSNGSIASTDIVATNDAGTELNQTGFIDMGINSSGNTSTGVLGGNSTAYLYSTGNDFSIGNSTASKSLSFFTTDATNPSVERMRIDGTGNVGIGTTSPSTKLHIVGANPLTLSGVAVGTNTSTDSLLTITSGLVRKLPLSSFATSTNAWSTTGNAGTTAGTNFIGTTDAQDFVLKANNTERFRIVNGVSSATGTTGDITIGDATSGTLRTNKELVLRQDGDQFGPSTLRLRNRNGENGAIFETIGASSGAYLVDFIFRTGASTATQITSNQRFETRSGNIRVAGNATEWQFGQPDVANGGPTLVVGAAGTGSNSSFRLGNLGIGATAFNSSNPEKLLADAGATGNTDFQNVIVGKGNTNNYAQLNIQNSNAGTAASSDVVATADNGSESANYIDMGINSSANTANNFGGINDAYLYATGNGAGSLGGNLLIGTSTATKDIYFLTGGGTKSSGTTLNNERMRILGTGNIGVGVVAPTAVLHLKAGTTAAGTAPLKFTSGTNLTSVENGAVEYDGTNYYATSGSTRYTLAKTLTATQTLDFPSTAAGASSTFNITVNGATDGDVVALGVPGSAASASGVFSAYVSSANTVTVKFSSTTAGADPASGTFRVSVLKY